MAYQWTPDSKTPLSVELYEHEKSAPTLKHFEVDKSRHSHKEITLDLDCNSKTALSSTKMPGGLVEHLCYVDIGVYPMVAPTEPTNATKAPALSDNERMGATYELSYQIAGVHTMLYSNHMTVVNLQADESRLFQFNVHEEVDESDSLAFILQMAYGQAELKVSKTERNPCAPSNPSQSWSVMANHNRFTSLKIGKGGVAVTDLRGSYFVCVHAGPVLTSLLIMANPNLGSKSLFSGLNSGILHLLPNHNLIGEITEDQASVQFTFTPNLGPEDNELIIINVSPIKGNDFFRITVSNNGYEPNVNQAYWNIIGNTFSISSKDPMFKPKAEYRVKISIPTKAEYKSEGIHRFTVAYSIGLKDILLQEGLPYVGEFSDLIRDYFFRIEVPAGAKNLTILKSLIDQPFSIACTIQSNNKSASSSTFNISDFQGGHMFDTLTLSTLCPGIATTSCNFYMKASSKTGHGSFLMSFSVDNRPFTLHRDYGYNLPPSPTFDVYQFYFIYHIPTGKHKNFSLDCENPYQDMRCYVKFAKETQELSFPSHSAYTKLLIGQFANLDFGPKNYEDNSLMLVTVDLLPNNDIWSIIKKLNHQYTFALQGKIRVNTGPTKLLVGKPFKGKVELKKWKYFKIHHQSAENLVVNFESTFSTCRLYVTKGSSAKVNYQENLASSIAFQEKTIVVTPQMLKLGEPITGFYTLGVHCYSNSTIRLVYMTSLTQNTEIRLNDPVKIDAMPDVNTYVEFMNYGPVADLNIEFRSAKAGVSLFVTSFDPRTMLLATELNDPEFHAPGLPTEERYDFGTNNEVPIQGQGRLTIPVIAERYCHYCKLVMLVKVTEPDSVEILVRKSSPAWPTQVSEGEEQFALLRAGEVAYYMVEALRPNEEVPAMINLQEGHIKVDSSSKTFENVTFGAVLATEEAKGLKKQIRLVEDSEDRFTFARLFIRIRAVNESKITLNFAENLVVEEVQPLKPVISMLPAGFTKVFTLAVQDVQFVHGSLRVTAVKDLMPKDVDENAMTKAASKSMVRIYSADSQIAVINRKYYEVPTYLQVEKDESRVEFQFMPSGRIAVIEVKNPHEHDIHFTLETATKAVGYVKPRERVTTALHPWSPVQELVIPVKGERSVFTLDVHECVEHLVVQATFVQAGSMGGSGQIMLDQYVEERRLALNEGPGTLVLHFFMRDAFDNREKLSFVETKAKAKKVPTVFSFTYDIVQEGDPNRIGIERFNIRGEKGDINIEDLSGNVGVRPVIINDIDELLKTHNVRVTYSLVLARNVGLMNHLLRCGTFLLSAAKSAFASDDYYVLNHIEHITQWSQKDRKKKMENLKGFDRADDIILEPSMYAFGDPYQAAVFARVFVYGRSVLPCLT